MSFSKNAKISFRNTSVDPLIPAAERESMAVCVTYMEEETESDIKNRLRYRTTESTIKIKKLSKGKKSISLE